MLMDPAHSALLVIDVQERLAPAIADIAAVLARIGILIDAAHALGVPLAFTEQNPSGLGRTIASLRARAPQAPYLEKMHFQATLEPALPAWLDEVGAWQVVIAGAETHVCVLQSALGVIATGRAVYLVDDATGSRRERDRLLAIERLRSSGCAIVSCEMVVFEWLKRSGTAEFRRLLPLVRDAR